MAGAYVFPGGRVDAADRSTDETWCDGLDRARAAWPDLEPAEAVAYHVAALRELFEEAGVLLARDRTGRMVAEGDDAITARLTASRAAIHSGETDLGAVMRAEGLRLVLDALQPLAHWVTPVFEAKRFDARFFVARVPDGQSARHDAAETIGSAWMTAAGALERCRRGEIALPPPTWSTLADLARFGSLDAVLASTPDRAIFRREPRYVEDDGVPMLVLPGDPLYPAPEAERITVVHAETRFLLEDQRWRASSVSPTR
jgi:8-oxo-dGTP pyrophosphatase MutT (NUDIX family)